MSHPTGDTLAIKNGKILLPGGEFQVGDILLGEGQIREIGAGLNAESQIDASDCYVVPGLIDIHTHGIGYESAMKGDIFEYARLEAPRGTTSFYPTLFGPPDESAANIRKYREQTDELRLLPQVAGFRLESPYISRTGAGISRDLSPITPEITQLLLDAGEGHIKIWDISPELPGAPDVIRQLSSQEIVCSLAHTDATIDQARAAVNAGAKLVTHLFDTFVVPEMIDPGVYPVGLIDYLLIEDRIMCEIIADGTHALPILVEKALRCKSYDGIIFVTDGNFGAGLPPGRYNLPGGWGEAEISSVNNGVRLVDRNMGLAGSALTPIDVFRNVIHVFGKDIATASRLCSGNPARLLGLNKGEIVVGKDADLIIIDKNLDLIFTISAGSVVYRKSE